MVLLQLPPPLLLQSPHQCHWAVQLPAGVTQDQQDK
jgi:hypothetical protein